jgi:hypothetical protein
MRTPAADTMKSFEGIGAIVVMNGPLNLRQIARPAGAEIG